MTRHKDEPTVSEDLQAPASAAAEPAAAPEPTSDIAPAPITLAEMEAGEKAAEEELRREIEQPAAAAVPDLEAAAAAAHEAIRDGNREAQSKRAEEHAGELGSSARYLLGAAAGYRQGKIVGHDGNHALLEHEDGTTTVRAVGEYELQ